VIALFGDEDMLEVLRMPESVEAFRLKETFSEDGIPDDDGRTAGPIELDAELSEQLATLMLDPDTYEWRVSKACDPRYGVLVQFTAGDTTVEVLYCFECDILAIYVNGEFTGIGEFDHGSDQLAQVFKEVFPDDEVIQGL